jgi:hypothetical protein
MQEDGTVTVQDTDDVKKAVWRSDLSSAAKKQRQFQIKAVVDEGALRTYRSGELAWASAP